MKEQRGGVLRYILIIVLALILIRFSAVIVRIIQAIAFGVRGLWWVIFPTLVVAVLIWRVKGRALRGKKPHSYPDEQGLRDVTHSMDKSQ